MSEKNQPLILYYIVVNVAIVNLIQQRRPISTYARQCKGEGIGQRKPLNKKWAIALSNTLSPKKFPKLYGWKIPHFPHEAKHTAFLSSLTRYEDNNISLVLATSWVYLFYNIYNWYSVIYSVSYVKLFRKIASKASIIKKEKKFSNKTYHSVSLGLHGNPRVDAEFLQGKDKHFYHL